VIQQTMMNLAYVRFDFKDETKKALCEMNKTKLSCVLIWISLSNEMTRKSIESGHGRLFILGLDENIEITQLHEAFSTFGSVFHW